MQKYKQRITSELYEAVWAFMGIEGNDEKKLGEVIFTALNEVDGASPMILADSLWELVKLRKQLVDFEVKKDGSDVDTLRDATDYENR